MTDITTRLLSMSEAMFMDRDQEEVDALLLEAKEEIDRLREALKPFIAAAGMLPETYGPDYEPIPDDETVSVQCCGFYLGDITVADLNRVYELSSRAALVPQQKGNADGK
jgi:hypothetical protein